MKNRTLSSYLKIVSMVISISFFLNTPISSYSIDMPDLRPKLELSINNGKRKMIIHLLMHAISFYKKMNQEKANKNKTEDIIPGHYLETIDRELSIKSDSDPYGNIWIYCRSFNNNEGLYAVIDQYGNYKLTSYREAAPVLSDLKKITNITRKWAPNMDILSPIDESQIPGFRQWIVWNDADNHILNQYNLGAFDWAAYLNRDGEPTLGLPPELKIRAIADGRVVQISDDAESYDTFITIEHGKEGSGLFSRYYHVVPKVKLRQEVKKGGTIAVLYKDPRLEENDKGHLVHLHFVLANSHKLENRYEVDPEEIYNHIVFAHASPQRSLDFKIAESEKNPAVVIANFREIDIEVCGEDRHSKKILNPDNTIHMKTKPIRSAI